MIKTVTTGSGLKPSPQSAKKSELGVPLELTIDSVNVLNGLQHKTGLFSASVTDDYKYAWIRDNVYAAMGFEAINDYETVREIYSGLFNILKRYEFKIDRAIEERPVHAWQYIHARFNPDSLDEIWDNWGNKQNDTIGALLFKIGDLYWKGLNFIDDKDNKRIVQKLIGYLGSIEYWKMPDQGMWEIGQDLRSSSIGACVAGLISVSSLPHINVPRQLVIDGKETLRDLLPKEHFGRDVDMALLSLIYPYNILSREHKMQILEAVENDLVRETGVIRYKGDDYVQENLRSDPEPEWVLGRWWLAKIYQQMGRVDDFMRHFSAGLSTRTNKGFPELYYNANGHNNSPHIYVPNIHIPLLWSEAMFLTLFEGMAKTF